MRPHATEGHVPCCSHCCQSDSGSVHRYQCRRLLGGRELRIAAQHLGSGHSEYAMVAVLSAIRSLPLARCPAASAKSIAKREGRNLAGARPIGGPRCAEGDRTALCYGLRRAEQGIVRQVGEKCGFGDSLNKHRYLAALGGPAKPVTEVGVGVGGIVHLRVLN
jgi:hypothetical protein